MTKFTDYRPYFECQSLATATPGDDVAEPHRLAIVGSWETHGSPWRRRAGISAAVTFLHAMLVLAVLATQWLTRRPVVPVTPYVVWMTLEEQAAAG